MIYNDLQKNITEVRNLWDYLAVADKPIVLYGMGDGALKILRELNSRDISVSGIFASDEFVRGQSFLGMKVKTLSEIEQELDDFIILLCFGSKLPSVVDRIKSISAKHELYAPDVPVAGDDLFTYEYFCEHLGKFQQSFDLLADDYSKKVFINIINYKISGKLDFLFNCQTNPEEIYNNFFQVSGEESFLDLGAYDGDTVVHFIERAKTFRNIIAVEADPKNFKKLERNLQNLNLNQIECHNVGIWDCDTTLGFNPQASRNSGIQQDNSPKSGVKGDRELVCRSVDSIVDGREVSYIKIDIEGAEEQALRGAKETIQKFFPKMNVAVYHKTSDLYLLPLLVHNINSDYKIYLRHDPCVPAWEINLFFV